MTPDQKWRERAEVAAKWLSENAGPFSWDFDKTRNDAGSMLAFKGETADGRKLGLTLKAPDLLARSETEMLEILSMKRQLIEEQARA